MAAKKRSGFMFMFVILLLLGVIIYTYRDKFYVLFNTGYTSSKDYIDKKFNKKENNKTVTEKINLLDRLKKGKELKDKIDNIRENVNEIKEKVQENTLDVPKEEELVLNNEKNKEHPVQKKDEESLIDEKKEVKQKQVEEKKEIVTKEKSKVNNNNKINIDQKLNHRVSKLYFTKLVDDEKMSFITVSRNVSYVDTPLTETLRSLLNGPNKEEITSNIITNIPGNTKLLSVYIKNNTAFINLSKEFEYNSYGRVSTLAQIKQIVFTATEFDSVKHVQILINGEVKKYLGGEGVMINKPYSRNDFS